MRQSHRVLSLRAVWRVRIARRLGVWLTLWQLATVIGALQLSGLVQLVTDVVSAGDTDDDVCPNEKPGRDCPPGCPSCHCVHAVAAAPRAVAVSLIPAAVADERSALLEPRVPPPSPARSSVWRPPRTT